MHKFRRIVIDLRVRLRLKSACAVPLSGAVDRGSGAARNDHRFRGLAVMRVQVFLLLAGQDRVRDDNRP